MAILALQRANFLLLDEPTNHLDIPAQETLQEALEHFEGTILLVSHDRYLIDRLATQVWDLRDGRLTIYGDGYQSYLAQRDKGNDNGFAPPPAAQVAPEPQSTALSKNEQRRRAAQLQALEDEVHALELELARLTAALQEATLQQEVDEIRAPQPGICRARRGSGPAHAGLGGGA